MTKVQRTNLANTYDPTSLDDLLPRLVGRRVYYDQAFPPNAHRLRSIFFSTKIGEPPAFEDVALIISTFKRTRSDKVLNMAIDSLRSYLLDCSGNDPSLKPEVQDLLFRTAA